MFPLSAIPGSSIPTPRASSTPGAHAPVSLSGSSVAGAQPIQGQTAPLQVKRIFIGNITLNKGKANECIRGVFVTLKDQNGNPMDLPEGWPPIDAARREKCKEIFETLITRVQELKPTANLESASVSRDGFKFTDPSKQTIGFTANSESATDGTQAIWSNFRDTLLTGNTDGQLSANIESGPLPSPHSLRASFDSHAISGSSAPPIYLSLPPSAHSRGSLHSHRATAPHAFHHPSTASHSPPHRGPSSARTVDTSPIADEDDLNVIIEGIHSPDASVISSPASSVV